MDGFEETVAKVVDVAEEQVLIELPDGSRRQVAVPPQIDIRCGQEVGLTSAELAVGWLETLDDDLVIFDSEGRPLRLEAGSQDRRWPGYTMALRERAEPRDEGSLRHALMRALGVSDAAEEVPLAELVAQAAERFETRNPSGADLLRALVPGFLRRKRN